MSFAINILTSDGAALIAQATAANPIVIVGGLAGNTAAVDAADLESKPKSFYHFTSGNPNGVVFQASATANVCRIVIAWYNKDTALSQSEIIKSACVLAKLQSQSDSDAIILTASSDDNSEAYLPSEDSEPIAIHIPFNVVINSDDQVETVGAEYASMADLERFMSLHKAGNPNAGDDQSVKGQKTFEDDTTFIGYLIAEGTSQFDGTVYVNGNLNTDQITGTDTNSRLTLNTTIKPSSTDTIDLGILGSRFKDGYIKNLYSEDVKCNSIALAYGGGFTEITMENGQFKVGSGIYPDTNMLYDLGTSQRRWRNIYADSYKIGTLTLVDDGEGLEIHGGESLILRDSGGNYANIYCKNVNASNLSGNLVGNVTGNVTGNCTGGQIVQSEVGVFTEVQGLLTSMYDEQVGALAEIEVSMTSSGGGSPVTYNRGTIVYNGKPPVSGHPDTLLVKMDGDTAQGQWMLLNKIQITSSSFVKVLAVRYE